MNDNLRILLNEYEQKRIKAINDARQTKYDIYDKIPELEKVDNDINSLSIKLIQLVSVKNLFLLIYGVHVHYQL